MYFLIWTIPLSGAVIVQKGPDQYLISSVIILSR